MGFRWPTSTSQWPLDQRLRCRLLGGLSCQTAYIPCGVTPEWKEPGAKGQPEKVPRLPGIPNEDLHWLKQIIEISLDFRPHYAQNEVLEGQACSRIRNCGC